MVEYQPKIMVVDDDDGLRYTLSEILEEEGFEVTAVSDGLESVELATANHFDLIFMDFRMPGIDGVEAFRRIKVVSPDSVVIMVTAYAGAPVEEALEEGAYAIIYKPFDLEQLKTMVRTTLMSTCVLVVDDEPGMRKMVRAILEDSGFQVSEAKIGKQAVTKAGRKHYDVILMDAVMPGMDGFTACQEIVEKDPEAKVIFLTAHSVVNWVRQALSAGAFSLLEKPVEPEDMISLLNSVVEGKSTRVGGSVNEA